MTDSETSPAPSGKPGSTGLVFDIKRYAINDGPGIRIAVYFKGCNLNCAWCHNPEGISVSPERLYSVSRCILCGTCVAACTEKALTLTPEGILTDTDLCLMHGDCAVVCPTKAIEISGRFLATEEIMVEIRKERIFFEQSGGGVTFSGGEPLLFPQTLIPLLDQCGEEGFHRAVDTAGLTELSTLLEVARRTDLFLYDLKMMDPDRHRAWTGVSNRRILDNLVALAGTGANIIIRIPLVGGVNDDEENLTATARFVASLPGRKKEVSLLPYHKIAMPKYARLGRIETFRSFREPTEPEFAMAVACFEKEGLTTRTGS